MRLHWVFNFIRCGNHLMKIITNIENLKSLNSPSIDEIIDSLIHYQYVEIKKNN